MSQRSKLLTATAIAFLLLGTGCSKTDNTNNTKTDSTEKEKENNACISGMCFKITRAELAATDYYEVQEYIRVQEYTLSGKKVWIYVANSEVQLCLLGK